jgi:iron(III) transport system substrate-binding protein
MVLGLGLVLAACGSSPTAGPQRGDQPRGNTSAEAVYREFNGLTGPDRIQRIVQAAEKEGQLSLYTTLTPDAADAVKKAFEAKYKIKVSVYRASSETILQRVQSEQKAGYSGNDALELNGLELTAMNRDGYLADFNGEARAAIIPSGQRPGWTADRLNLFVASRNTKLAPEAPATFEGFTDPKWRGKLSIEQGDVDWYMTLRDYYLGKGKSEAEVTNLFEKLAANSKVISGHAPQIQGLSSGQFAVALATYSYQAQQSADKGAPIAYEPIVEPVVLRPNGVAMMKTAAHPAAAYLFYQWLLTDGQQVIKDVGLTSSLASAANKGLEGVEIAEVDLEKLLNENKQLSDEYENLLTNH